MNSHITFVERHVSATRTTVIPVAADRERVERHLTGAMMDAEREIVSTFLRRTAQMGYASMGHEKIDNSPRAEESEDCACMSCDECKAYRYKLDLLKTLKANIRNAEYGILLDMTAFEFGLTQVCEQRAMSPERIIESYTKALNEWCVVRVWGER